MKYLISIAAGLVIVLIFAVSCGISQEEFNKAAGNLASLNATYQQVNNDLASKAAELDCLDAKYDDASSNLTIACNKLSKLKLEVAIYNAVFIPALTGELDSASAAEQQKIINNIEEKIEALNDPILSRKYNQMKFSADADATAEFFLYLLQDMETTLE